MTNYNKYLNEFEDKSAIRQVIGCLLQDPTLLKTYLFREQDFGSVLYKTIFIAIHTIIKNGGREVRSIDIDNWLSVNCASFYEKYSQHCGLDGLETIKQQASLENFELYYDRVRKWSVLKELAMSGIDVSEYFDPEDVSMGEETERKRERFESDSVDSILSYYKTKLLKISSIFKGQKDQESKKAGGEETLKQLDLWKLTPDFGLSYASQLLTTITYGLRTKRYTVMSAPSGTGKTRLTIANMCFSFAPFYWDSKKKEWVANQHGTSNSALYIGTEMELKEEVEPIILAYIADVPEDHITQNKYEEGEEERVRKAATVLRQRNEDGTEKNCGIFLEYLPEYDIQKLEDTIETYVTSHGVTAVFFDYIYSNPKLLAEYATSAKGRFSMREDQALANLSTKLKEITRKYNVSIDTCTQVSGDYKNSENLDETVVRGAKSIIDKCDVGIILTNPSQREKAQLEPITRRSENLGKPEPNVCLTVYKNRSGRYNKVKVWLHVNYRTMRVSDLYVTNKEYEIVPVEKTRVIVDELGKRHQFTSTEAMDKYKHGVISEEVYKEVRAQEKMDPSNIHITSEDRKRLAQAEKDIDNTDYFQPSHAELDEEEYIESEDGDYAY